MSRTSTTSSVLKQRALLFSVCALHSITSSCCRSDRDIGTPSKGSQATRLVWHHLQVAFPFASPASTYFPQRVSWAPKQHSVSSPFAFFPYLPLGFMSPLCFFFLTMLCLFLLANTACEQQRPLTPCSKVLICCCKNSLLVKGFTDVSTKSFQQILNLLSTSRLRKSTERLTFTKHSKARGTVQKVFIWIQLFFKRTKKILLFFLNWVNSTSAALSHFTYDTITHSVYL